MSLTCSKYFSFKAHDSPVRCMVWSHNDLWMVTGDHSGFVKYWQSNMNNVKMFQAHKEPLRGIRWAGLDGLPFHLGDVNCTWIFKLVLNVLTCVRDALVLVFFILRALDLVTALCNLSRSCFSSVSCGILSEINSRVNKKKVKR